MTKYLVDVYLPAIGTHYDAYLPSNKRIGEVVRLLVKVAESLSGGGYKGSSGSVLLNAADGRQYSYDVTVYDAGIRNSSRLILI